MPIERPLPALPHVVHARHVARRRIADLDDARLSTSGIADPGRSRFGRAPGRAPRSWARRPETSRSRWALRGLQYDDRPRRSGRRLLRARGAGSGRARGRSEQWRIYADSSGTSPAAYVHALSEGKLRTLRAAKSTDSGENGPSLIRTGRWRRGFPQLTPGCPRLGVRLPNLGGRPCWKFEVPYRCPCAGSFLCFS